MNLAILNKSALPNKGGGKITLPEFRCSWFEPVRTRTGPNQLFGLRFAWKASWTGLNRTWPSLCQSDAAAYKYDEKAYKQFEIVLGKMTRSFFFLLYRSDAILYLVPSSCILTGPFAACFRLCKERNHVTRLHRVLWVIFLSSSVFAHFYTLVSSPLISCLAFCFYPPRCQNLGFFPFFFFRTIRFNDP